MLRAIRVLLFNPVVGPFYHLLEVCCPEQVELEPGDIVYYNSQFWHRGWNPLGEFHGDRWTLHCSWQDCRMPLWRGQAQQQKPMGTRGHLDRFPPLAKLMAHRYQDAVEVELSADEAVLDPEYELVCAQAICCCLRAYMS